VVTVSGASKNKMFTSFGRIPESLRSIAAKPRQRITVITLGTPFQATVGVNKQHFAPQGLGHA